MIAQTQFQLLPTVATVISILGAVIAAIYAWRKSKPEAFHMLVDSASDIVVLQKGYIDRQEKVISDLQKSLESAHTQIKMLQAQAEEVHQLQATVIDLQGANDRLQKRLSAEIEKSKALEERLDKLDKI